jgi:PAS domain S-box-containing protein
MPLSPVNPSQETSRLGQFITSMTWIAFRFGSVELLAFAVSGERLIGLAGVLTLGYGANMLVARWLLKRERINAAVLTACLGMLVLIVAAAPLVPIVIPALPLGALIVVALALPYLHGPPMRRLILAAWLAGSLLPLLGSFSSQPLNLPVWFATLFHVSTVAAALGLACLLLWQFTTRLNETVTQTQAVNTELQKEIAERQRTENALQASEERWRALIENSSDAIALLSPEGLVLYESPAVFRILGHLPEDRLDQNAFDSLHPDDRAAASQLFTELAQRPGWSITLQFRLQHLDGSWRWVEAIGMNLLTNPNVKALVLNYRDITQRKLAEEQLQHQVDHLAALRAIDLAITGSLDLRVTLNIILDQVIRQLHVEAATVLLLNPTMHLLTYAAGRGFRTPSITRSELRSGQGLAGRAILERQIVTAPDLQQSDVQFTRSGLLAGEAFVSYAGAPLIAKGQVKGVLEIFQRHPFTPDDEWLEFLEALAGQTAIAIDNSTLFDSLQRTNTELRLAYDTTLEGWSHALDLRDKETEGHSQRVTDVTIHLARALGLGEDEVAQFRRGALLHDIGKMGIPDNILLKPGKLTDEEWEIMRKHPMYAYELLRPISYLRPALEIPYCHHEKWDGTGYPRGLKGEQIPLAARIFAVADVWDALRSDRPYRLGWPEEKVREYIQAQAGLHFDPRVVETFLRLDLSE